MEAHRADRRILRAVAASRTLFCCALAGVLTLSIVATTEFGFGQQKKKKATPAAAPGLKGILPDEIPDSLALEAFEPLGKDWSKWSGDVSADLMKLYSEEIPDAAGQRKLIASIRGKLRRAEAAIRRSSTPATLRDSLVTLHGRILRRIDLAEAALDTLQADPQVARNRRIDRAWSELSTALRHLRRHLAEYRGGGGWLGYVRAEGIGQAIRAKNASAPDLDAAARRIRNRGKLPEQQQRNFLGEAAFVNLEHAIGELKSAVAAPPKKVNVAKLRSELKKLFAALEQYESTNKSAAAGAVRTAYDAVVGLSADDGEALAAAMRSNYFNYNFRLYVSERFLNRIAAEKRTESSKVRDYVLGANVYGNQVTTVRSGVDLKPSRHGARFDITLAGHVSSNTVGVTDQANVYTDGQHDFWAAQEVRFDGEQFHPHGRARISVNANNRTTGATTKYSNILLLGRIADRIAVSEANKRRGQSEAIARQKVADKVLPEFENEIKKTLAKANKDARTKWLKNLEEAGLKPDARSVRTTDSFLLLSSRVMRDGELGGARTNPGESPGWGVTLRIHESAMNNAFNRLKLKGRTLTQDELLEEIEKSLTNVLGRDYKKNKPKETGKPKPKSSDKFVLDPGDPIRFRIADGQLNLILRTGLKRAGQEDIPTQVITIPLQFDVKGKNILLTRGNVGVAPAKKPESAAKQIARAGIMRNKIQESITNEKLDNTLTIERSGGKKPVNVHIAKIETNNGWVTIWAN